MSVTALGGCAHNFIPPDINYDSAAPAKLTVDPPAPIKIVELPKPLPLPGQLKPIDGGKPTPRSRRPDRARQPGQRRRARSSRCATASSTPSRSIPISGGRALPSLYGARRDHRHRAAGRRAARRLRPRRRRRHRALDHRRYRERRGRHQEGPHPGQADEARADHQSGHQHGSADLPPRAALDREDLHGLGLLAVSRRSAHRASAAEPGGRRSRADCQRRRSRLDQLPLCDPGRQPGLASAARLRRRAQGLHRVPERHLPRARCRHCSSSDRPAAPSW